MRWLPGLPALLVGLSVAAAPGFGCRAASLSEQIALELPAILAHQPDALNEDVWTDVHGFYAARQGEPAWVDGRDQEGVAAAIRVLGTALEHGFDVSGYGIDELEEQRAALKARSAEDDDGSTPQQLAALDVATTGALLSLARDVALGRTAPAAVDGRWNVRRQAPDFVATLAAAAQDDDLPAFIPSVQPVHPEYAALRRALAGLHGQRKIGGWPIVAASKLTPGASDSAVAVLRQRLAAGGHLKAEAVNGSPEYGEEIKAAVESFQHLHALPATGVADRATLAAMNVTLDERIRQVRLNLERWRWMPDDFGARHFLVNVPYFHLIARENGQPVLDVRVVVGTRSNKTPLFSDVMTSVVFSPYWNIPDSIVAGETAPAVARDPDYLKRNSIEILRRHGHGVTPVDPSDVDWDDAEGLDRLAFRQRPGTRNALGHVKFLFPNEFNVYIHDTPADRLFARPGRAFSHGCVRVEEPERLARYVLRDAPEWTGERIVAAMRSGVERHVALREKIPVHLVYFTAWVDANGGLHFQPDVYGYDELHRKRFDRASRAPR